MSQSFDWCLIFTLFTQGTYPFSVHKSPSACRRLIASHHRIPRLRHEEASFNRNCSFKVIFMWFPSTHQQKNQQVWTSLLTSWDSYQLIPCLPHLPGNGRGLMNQASAIHGGQSILTAWSVMSFPWNRWMEIIGINSAKTRQKRVRCNWKKTNVNKFHPLVLKTPIFQHWKHNAKGLGPVPRCKLLVGWDPVA